MSTSFSDPTDPDLPDPARSDGTDPDATGPDRTRPVRPPRTEGTVPDDVDAGAPEESSRTATQWWPYLTSALAFLVAPYVIGVMLPAATATAVMLVLLPVAAFGSGLIDGTVFRSTWSFPALTGLLCWVALRLYSDPGTWIYAVGVFLLCLAGSHLGGRRRARGGATRTAGV